MKGKALAIGILGISVMFLGSVSMGESFGSDPSTDSNIFAEQNKDCGVCEWKTPDSAPELANTESTVCYKCHDRVDDGAWAHGPVAVGQCLICHDDFHGPESVDSLTRQSDELCYYCHDASRLNQHVDQVNSSECVVCHNPHSSENSMLLR
jgi:predicted CXXCH cytochrome family protein